MNPTKNDIPGERRVPVRKILSERLADLIDLQLQAKQAHWNVKGPNFIALHELFDRVADVVGGFVDEVAERIVALGGVAEGTLTSVSQRSKLPVYSLTITSGHDHVEALSTSLTTAGRSIRMSIDRVTELEDAGTADLFTGISREIDKQLWFVEAHLQTENPEQ